MQTHCYLTCWTISILGALLFIALMFVFYLKLKCNELQSRDEVFIFITIHVHLLSCFGLIKTTDKNIHLTMHMTESFKSELIKFITLNQYIINYCTVPICISWRADLQNVFSIEPLSCLRLHIKGTPLRSCRVTHLKRHFSKTCLFFFWLSTSVWHSSLSCDNKKICLLSVDHFLKTCIIYVDLRKALVTLSPVYSVQIHSNFKPSCQIDRGHNFIKVPQKGFDTLNTLVTREYMIFEIFYFKCVTRHTSVESF